MKVAILHDWLTGFRGGERVLEAFCEMFPEAPIYTLLHRPGSTSPTIESHPIHTSFLNSIPGVHEQYRKFLPLFPKAVESMRILGSPDLVLSSSHCVIKGLKKPIGSTHISYIHSPMRYLYDQYEVYFGEGSPLYQRLGMKISRQYLTSWDQRSNQNVDYMIANSEFVRRRIQKYYRMDSTVIHPFADLADFEGVQKSPPAKEDFYLMVTAFAPNKRVDMAIEAFNQLGRRLKIIGSGQQEKWLKSLAAGNVEFLGNQSRAQVIKNFAKAKALIFPGVEDFGITPIEALASGTPVIAFKEGGVLETLNEKVAHFFSDPSAEALQKAVVEFENRQYLSSDLWERAEAFSKSKFRQEMLKFIGEKLNKSK
jgi:glycosyltransferase involved in cell wall biosynthesis